MRRRVWSSLRLVRRCACVDLFEDLGAARVDRIERQHDVVARSVVGRAWLSARAPPSLRAAAWRIARTSDCLVGSLSSSIPALLDARVLGGRMPRSRVGAPTSSGYSCVGACGRTKSACGEAGSFSGGDDGRAGLRVVSGRSFVVTFGTSGMSAVSLRSLEAGSDGTTSSISSVENGLLLAMTSTVGAWPIARGADGASLTGVGRGRLNKS